MAIPLVRGWWSVVESLEQRRLLTGDLAAAGDLNRDGLADLAIIHRDIAARNILLSTHINEGVDATGRRKLTPRASVDLTIEEFTAMTTGDINGDGCPDIVVAGLARNGVATGAGAAAGAVMVVFGDGQGGFLLDADGRVVKAQLQNAVDAAGLSGVSVAAGDLDGDGRDDIALLPVSARPTLPFAYIFWSDPKADPVRTIVPLPPNLTADTLFAGDVDGDGIDDLVIAQGQSTPRDRLRPHPNVVALLGAADRRGKLGSVQSNPLFEDKGPNGNNPLYGGKRLAGVGDLDGDGAAELIAVRRSGSIIAADFDFIVGRWKAPELNANSDSLVFDPDGFAVGDFDGDGLADIAAWAGADLTPRRTSISFSILYWSNDAKLIWSPRSNIFLYSDTLPIPNARATADLDGDGLDDIVAARPVRDSTGAPAIRIETYLNNGDQSFRADDQKMVKALDANPYGLAVATGDINGDGLPDVVVAYASDALDVDGSVSVTGYYITLLSDPTGGGGGSPDAKTYPIPHILETRPPGTKTHDLFRTVSLGDLDGDGLDDLVVGTDDQLVGVTLDIYGGPRQSTSQDSSLAIDLGKTGRKMLSMLDYGLAGKPEPLLSVSPDGVLELLTWTPGDAATGVAGGFYPTDKVDGVLIGADQDVWVGDFDGDAKKDDIITVNASLNATLVISIGDERQIRPLGYPATETVDGMLVGDLDGDGVDDLFAVSKEKPKPASSGSVKHKTGHVTLIK